MDGRADAEDDSTISLRQMLDEAVVAITQEPSGIVAVACAESTYPELEVLVNKYFDGNQSAFVSSINRLVASVKDSRRRLALKAALGLSSPPSELGDEYARLTTTLWSESGRRDRVNKFSEYWLRKFGSKRQVEHFLALGVEGKYDRDRRGWRKAKDDLVELLAREVEGGLKRSVHHQRLAPDPRLLRES